MLRFYPGSHLYMEDLAITNLKSTYLLYHHNRSFRPKRTRELDQTLRDVRAISSYPALASEVSDNIKRRKVEEIRKDNPRYDPDRSVEHLQQILQHKEQASSSQTLDIFNNRHLTFRLKKVQPQWHAPWKLMRVISGHHGWVRCISVDPTNEWFATGSNDRTIKIWDLASGECKLTLVGHINAVRGVVVSDRHSYMFSCSEDKSIKCWDLEYNKVIRNYHGHLSGVYCMSLHPTLDVLVSGGRDTAARVWDIRTKTAVRVLEGHTSTVFTVDTQASEPQVITGSADATVRLWDLASGKSTSVLTRHKKGIRSVKFHHSEYTLLSAAADNIKLWKCPEGTFLRNFSGHNAIINSLAINNENVMVTGADDGSLFFWDYNSGYNFQQITTRVQPGSLSSENSIFDIQFDKSGLRMITAECDKTIKIWREDEDATPDTHPIPEEARVFVKPKY